MTLIPSVQEKPFKIGDIELDNRVVLAPMAGVCNSAFRLTVKEFGAVPCAVVNVILYVFTVKLFETTSLCIIPSFTATAFTVIF